MPIRWTRSLLSAVAITLAAGPLLSGCGAKGPLYLPQQTQEAR